jgi:titin
LTAVPPETNPEAITGYSMSAYDDEGQVQTGKTCVVVDPATSMECAISGLENGEIYTFKSVGQTIGGNTQASPFSYAVMPHEAVEVPAAPEVEPTDGGIVVVIEPTEDADADAYIAKAFSADPENPSDWTITEGTCFVDDVDTDEPTCTITGLENGVAHRVSVRGQVNGLTSEPSDLSAEVVPEQPEGVPGVPQPHAANSSASFVIPLAESGDPTGYGVRVYSQDPTDPNIWNVEAGSCETSETTDPVRCTVTGLTNGTNYRARAVSYSDDEASEESRNSGVFNPQPPPGPMAAPSLVAQDLRITASVNKSTSGGDVDYYVVNAYRSDRTLAATCSVNDPNEEPLECVLTNIPNDVLYTVTATAYNGAGSQVSDASEPTAPSTLPAPPAAPTAAIGNGSVTVTVTPAQTGGSPRWFDVKTYGGDGAIVSDRECTVVVASSSRSCTVTGLTNGTAYTFRAVARNDVGSSIESGPSLPVLPGPPATPAVPTVVMRKDGSAKNKALAQVSVRAGIGGTPTQIVVNAYLNGRQAGQCTVSGGLGSCNIFNLTSGSSYVFRATAVSGAGTSAPSAGTVAIKAP